MEKTSLKNLSDSYSIPVHIVPSTNRENEISLADLWTIIAKHRWILFLNILASLTLSITYVFLATPIYKTQTYLLPPLERNIQPFLFRDHDNKISYTTNSIYKEYLTNLNSRGLRREFFEAHNLKHSYLSREPNTQSDIDQIFDQEFSENLRIHIDTPSTSYTRASFSHTNAKLAAEWLNQFILFVDNRTTLQISDGIDTELEGENKQIRYQIKIKLRSARQTKRDRITILQEAIRIAKALGIENAGGLRISSENAALGMLANMDQAPLYLRGVKALETQVSILESRKSEEPFIPGLRDLQERLTYLEGLPIETAAVSAVTVDSAARVPYRTEGPRKTLIIMLAALLGTTAGLLMIFIYQCWLKARVPS